MDLIKELGFEKTALLLFYASHINENFSNRQVAHILGKSEYWVRKSNITFQENGIDNRILNALSIALKNAGKNAEKNLKTTLKSTTYGNESNTQIASEIAPTIADANASKSQHKSIEIRVKDFYNSLVPYVAQYGKHMIREFYNYWSEPNKSQTKMRFEMEKTWSLERRLARWFNNNNTNKAYGKFGNDNQSVQRRQDEVQGLINELLAEDEAKRNSQE